MINQYKDILKHAIIYGLTGLLGRALGFLMIPIYTRYLTPADYGVIEILDVFVSIIGVLVCMGISMSVFKFYYSYDSKKEKNEVISTAIIFTFLITGVFVFTGVINRELLSNLLFQTNAYTKYIKIVLFTFLFDNTFNILLAFIRAQQKSLLYTTISIARLLIGLGLNIYFVVFRGMGVLGILYSGLIMSCSGSILLMVYVIKEVGIKFSIKNSKEMMRYGLPLVPSSIGMFVIHFGDRFFLQRFSDLSQVGLYSIAYKFGFMINLLIVLPFSLVWDAKMFEIEKQDDAKQVYKRVFTYFMFLLIFSFTAITILIKDAMSIVVDEKFFDAYKIVPFIACAYVFNGSCYMLRIGLYLRKKTEYIGIVTAITTCVTIVIYYILIPSMGAMGAAISTLLSFLFWNVLTYVVSQRVYKIRYEWGRIAKLCLTSILLIFFSDLIYFDHCQLSFLLKSFIILLFPLILIALYFYQKPEIDLIKKTVLKLSNSLRLIKITTK
ncbi:MAG: oligosaccharide flippase family protein [Candidatus Scalindua sp.]|nr:oligosaccharide flippase family protein [Candidatus Scalindua sp.]